MADTPMDAVVARVEAAAARFEAEATRVVAELERMRETMSSLQLAQTATNERDKSRTKDLERVERLVSDHESRLRGLERMVWKAVGAGLAAGAAGSFVVRLVMGAP